MSYKLFITLLTVLLISTTVSAATYISVEDDAVYGALSRLEAEGVIKSGLLDTRPISRKEAYRLLHEAEANSVSGSDFIKALVQSLKDRLGPEPAGKTQVKPLDSAYAAYVHTNADVHATTYANARENEQALNYNNNGELYRRGSNERLGFFSRIEDWGPLSIEINPEYRYPSASYIGYSDALYSKEELVAKKAYAVLDLGWDVVLGKDSQWWGPGYHGALLMTNNAEPLTMLKLANPEPVHLPWIFDSLGPIRFTFFVTNLENTRSVPDPYLYGMRFDFKPSPYIDIAFEKTALVGGKGRPHDLKILLESLISRTHGGQDYKSSNYVNIDDERAGLDIKVTIPWRIQPMQIYLEADGEDQSSRLPVPQSWAFVEGIYLPRILGEERLDLRLEYATTQGRVLDPSIWYTHVDYTSYTYKGNIIGHHIGTNAEDIYAVISYLIPGKNGRVFLSYDREKHNLQVSGSHETLDDITAGVKLSLTSRIEFLASYSHGWLKNIGNISGPTVKLSEYETGIEYRF